MGSFKFLGKVKSIVKDKIQNLRENQAKQQELKEIEKEAYHQARKEEMLWVAKKKARYDTDEELKKYKDKKENKSGSPLGGTSEIIDNIASSKSEFEGGITGLNFGGK